MNPDVHPIAERLEAVRALIADAGRKAGRAASDVGLVAVSKNHPVEAIREAFVAGQRVFGESRVQELLAKAPELPGGATVHFIGHLQTNKIRKALPHADLIHAVDSAGLATEIDRVAADLGLFPRVLLEVNVAGEASKFGFAPDRLEEAIAGLLALNRVQVEGLMTIAPYAEDPEEARPHFAALRSLRDRLAASTGTPLPTLSMGMSGDFAVAIEEGATLVRIGTAIFGDRPRPPA